MFRRQIDLATLVTISTTLVIGPGLFAVPGIALKAGGYSGAMLGWLVAAATIIPFLSIFASFHAGAQDGGPAGWVQAHVGESAKRGMLFVQLVTGILLIPALATAGAQYFCGLADFAKGHVFTVAMLFAIAACACAMCGSKVHAWLSRLSLLGTLALMGCFIFFNAKYFAGGAAALSTIKPPASSEPFQIGGILILSFIGWETFSLTCRQQNATSAQIKLGYWLAFALVLAFYGALALIVGGAYLAGLRVDSATCFLPLLEALPPVIVRSFPIVISGIILANLTSWFVSTIRIAKEVSGGSYNEGIVLVNFVLVVLHFMDKNFVGLSTLIAASNVGFLIIYAMIALAHYRFAKSWATGFALAGVALLLTSTQVHWASAIPFVAFALGCLDIVEFVGNSLKLQAHANLEKI